MALRVWCHECGVPHITNPNITNGVLRCPGCLSEFAEIQYDPALRTPAPPVNLVEGPPSSPARPPSPPHSNLRSLLQQQLTGQASQAGGTAHVEGQAFGPASQSRTHRFRDPNSGTNVEVHVTTTPVTPDMLRGGFPGGLGLPPGHTMMLTMPVDVALAGLGGLFPGMEGGAIGTENFDQILTNILNQYQPAAQPAARSVVERLPRRRVRRGPENREERLDAASEHVLQREGQAPTEASAPAPAASEGAEGAAGARDQDKDMDQGHDLAEHTGSDGQGSGDKASEDGAAGAKPAAKFEAAAEAVSAVGGPAGEERPCSGGREVGGKGGPRERQEKRGEGEEWARCQAGEPCSVCLSLFGAGEVAVELPCGHDFHESCILPWLEEHHTCPTCRGPLPMEDETQPSVSAADIRDAAHRTVQRQNSVEVHHNHPPAHASRTQPQGGEAAAAGRQADFTHYPELAEAQHNLAQRLHSIRTRVRALQRRQAGEGSRETQARETEEPQQRQWEAHGGPSWVSVQAMEEEIRQLEEGELRPLEEHVQQEQQHILQEQRTLQQSMQQDLEQRERVRERQRQQQQQQQQQQGNENQGTLPHPLMGLDVSWGPMLSVSLPSILDSTLGSSSEAVPFGHSAASFTSPARIHPSPPSLVLRGPHSIPAAAAAAAAAPSAARAPAAAHRRLGMPSNTDGQSSSNGGRGAASTRSRSASAAASEAARAPPAPQEQHPHASHYEHHHHHVISFGLPPFLGLPLAAPEPPAVSLVSRVPPSSFPAADTLPLSDEPQAYEVPTLAPIRLSGRINEGSSNQGSATPSPSAGASAPRPRFTAGGNSRGTTTGSNSSSGSTSRGAREGSNSTMRGLARGFLASAGGTRPSARATRNTSTTTTTTGTSTSTRPHQRSTAAAASTPSSSPSSIPQATQAATAAPPAPSSSSPAFSPGHNAGEAGRRSCKRTAEGEVVCPSSTSLKPTTCSTSLKAPNARDSQAHHTDRASTPAALQHSAHQSAPQQAAKAADPSPTPAKPLPASAAPAAPQPSPAATSSTQTKEEPGRPAAAASEPASPLQLGDCSGRGDSHTVSSKSGGYGGDSGSSKAHALQEHPPQPPSGQQQQQEQQQQQPMRRPSLGAALTAPLRWLSGGRLGRQQAAAGGQQSNRQERAKVSGNNPGN